MTLNKLWLKFIKTMAKEDLKGQPTQADIEAQVAEPKPGFPIATEETFIEAAVEGLTRRGRHLAERLDTHPGSTITRVNLHATDEEAKRLLGQ